MSTREPVQRVATLIGGSGYIGRNLAAHLASEGMVVRTIGRGDDTWRNSQLGSVFYCAGLTADFRSRPFETIEAHTSFISELLQHADFTSMVYLSSTRVYARAISTDELSPLIVSPADPSDLYNLSKLTGEAICVSSGRANVRIARLSNIYGGDTSSENFLTSIIREATTAGHVDLSSDLSSAKDYLSIGDAVRALSAISSDGTEQTYNVASGRNTSHAAIIERICAATGCTVMVKHDAPLNIFPPINVNRINTLIGPSRENVLDHIEDEIAKFRLVNLA